MKIESVQFYKQIYPSTQVYEKSSTPNAVMAISLPRVRFLEANGAYRPTWAVDKVQRVVELPPDAPAAQQKVFKRSEFRRTMLDNGNYEFTLLEIKAHELFESGYTNEEIQKKLNKQASVVTSAIKRYKIKAVAKANKK
jgi:DNA-binding CsgD family transcriptional regulator